MDDDKGLPLGWSEVGFKESCTNVSLTGIKVKEKEYKKYGKFPTVDQGKELIGGYFDDENMVINEEPPYIVFGDHTKVKKFITFKFIPGGDGLKVLKANKIFDPKLLYYFIQAIKLPDKGYARHYQYLEKEIVPLPPINEQHRIVERLEELFSELDSGVKALKTAQEQLKVYRQAVLKDAFEDVKGEGIVEKKIRDISNLVTSGSRGWAKYYSNKGAKFIRIGNLTRDSIKLDNSDIQAVALPDKAEGVRSQLKGQDLLISITADIGSIAVIPDDIGEAYINQHISLVRLIDLRYSKYIAYYLKSETGRKRLLKNQRGATKKGLGLDDIRDTYVPMPDIKVANKIVMNVEKHLSTCDNFEETIEQSLAKAEILRQSILQRAFTGQLVGQDPNDESACKLLERIRLARENDKVEKEAAKGRTKK